jgi:hypothetical protein
MTRREAVTGAGLVLAGAVLPAARGTAAADVAAVSSQGATVILLGTRHAASHGMARHLGGDNARLIPLQADPVRQWRDPRAQLLAARDTRMFGVTTWPEFLMVRGLAEESGRRVRYQRADVASGAVCWLIA